MDPVHRANDDLRDLVDELDAKIGTRRSAPANKSSLRGERTIDLTDEQPQVRRRMPGWLGLTIIIVSLVGLATIVVRPWDQCSYSTDVCRIAQLDIDALRVGLPNSELIAELPNIDALDPDDVLTVGEVFEMERFSEWDLEELLTDAEVEQMLATID